MRTARQTLPAADPCRSGRLAPAALRCPSINDAALIGSAIHGIHPYVYWRTDCAGRHKLLFLLCCPCLEIVSDAPPVLPGNLVASVDVPVWRSGSSLSPGLWR